MFVELAIDAWCRSSTRCQLRRTRGVHFVSGGRGARDGRPGRTWRYSMLSAERNAYMTRVGPGTPMGEFFRRFWLPVLVPEQLAEADGDPARIRVLGEDLVAFRDTNGQIGIVDAFCPHRRAPLFFGRNEECGLRCVYHGWKFDTTGQCVDMPSEPSESDFKERLQVRAYPAREWGGAVWIYMGPPEK